LGGVVAVCLFVGVAACRWSEHREPEIAVVANTPTPVPKRQLVAAKSRNLTFQQLQALGYVDGTFDPNSELRDVYYHDREKANPGLNFYNPRDRTGARLIDMEGHEVHVWDTDEEGVWHHAELLPNGDVIVVVKDQRMSRYDKDSNLIWTIRERFHHDFWIYGNEIYALARFAEVVDFVHPRSPILVEVIRIVSLDGELKKEISVLELVRDSPYRFLLPSIMHEPDAEEGRQLDILHTNHIEVFDGRLADRDPIYRKGNVLISIKNINTIAILDGESFEIVWIWGPTNLTFQHHPTLLESGNILLFDNGIDMSRVIEMDPLSGEIVWEYDPMDGFFSRTRGSNQRLPNGNTLITESDPGYVFEVSPTGEIVWRFANPTVRENGEREAIWRMTRFDPESLTFLDEVISR
jgi:hypothetical protein